MTNVRDDRVVLNMANNTRAVTRAERMAHTPPAPRPTAHGGRHTMSVASP